jgi:hypothetical protein
MGNKLLFLIIGILSGVIIGAGTMFYFTGSSAKKIFIVNQPKNKENSEGKIEVKIDEKKPPKKFPAYKTSEATSTDIKEESNFVGEDLRALGDSIKKDTIISLSFSDSEEIIIVKKDEFLFAKQVQIIDLDVRADNSGKDSLLAVISGIKEPLPVTNIIVEYWKSPINYKGYKMSRQKIVLFGLTAYDNPVVYKLNDNFYLKSSDRVYKIERNLEFKGYEPVIDANIIKLLIQ